MERINGVSFEEYASACGNLTQGMTEQAIFKILGIEKPVWDDTMNKWNLRFGELMTEDMGVATTYGEIFANPVAGRFGNGNSSATDIKDLLAIVPDYETYQKIFYHQSVAAQFGIDPVTIIESYGLDIGKWGSLNMHYLNYQNDLLDVHHPDYNNRYQYFVDLQNSWQTHFEDQYNDQKTDLGKDINF
jgi:triacylglycerol lipase